MTTNYGDMVDKAKRDVDNEWDSEWVTEWASEWVNIIENRRISCNTLKKVFEWQSIETFRRFSKDWQTNKIQLLSICDVWK